MPKYFRDKIADHYLYFTSKCIVEAMHVIWTCTKPGKILAAVIFIINKQSNY